MEEAWNHAVSRSQHALRYRNVTGTDVVEMRVACSKSGVAEAACVIPLEGTPNAGIGAGLAPAVTTASWSLPSDEVLGTDCRTTVSRGEA